MYIFFTISQISNQTKNPSIQARKGLKTAKKMKGDEGLDFTIHPQISNVYRHSRRKDEGMKGKIAFRF